MEGFLMTFGCRRKQNIFLPLGWLVATMLMYFSKKKTAQNVTRKTVNYGEDSLLKLTDKQSLI